MKKQSIGLSRKLLLNKETLTALNERQQQVIAGGYAHTFNPYDSLCNSYANYCRTVSWMGQICNTCRC